MNNDYKVILPERLNAELISAVRKKLPDGVNVAGRLMEILSLGKEAVYRRFRGEVPFTLAEAVVISRKLGVSLDRFTGMSLGGETMFDLKMFDHEDPFQAYYSTFDDYTNIFSNIENEGFTELWDAANRLPFVLCMRYDNMAKFHMFKGLYQNNALPSGATKYCFDTFEYPEKIFRKQKEFSDLTVSFDKNNYIWDNMIIASVVNELKYFSEIGLMSPDSVKAIKGELSELLDFMESVAARGHFPSGHEVQLYISNVNFESSYTYVVSEKSNLSLIRVYDMNMITSYDEKIYNNIKKWIQSLKKFSTLITQSAEKDRFRFFQQQRNLLDSL